MKVHAISCTSGGHMSALCRRNIGVAALANRGAPTPRLARLGERVTCERCIALKKNHDLRQIQRQIADGDK